MRIPIAPLLFFWILVTQVCNGIHNVFNLKFPNEKERWTPFHILISYTYLPSMYLFLMKGLFSSFARFLVRFFCCCWVSRVLCIFWIQIINMWFAYIFLPAYGLSFHSLHSVFCVTISFKHFHKVQLVNFFFCGSRSS